MTSAKKRNQGEELVDIFKKDGCKWCGEFRFECLCFHHIDPKTKKFAISNAVKDGYSLEIISSEIAKCIVLCHNCHALHHRMRRESISAEEDTVHG